MVALILIVMNFVDIQPIFTKFRDFSFLPFYPRSLKGGWGEVQIDPPPPPPLDFFCFLKVFAA